MQGQILSFQKNTNTGLISGHDGNRYDFTRADWRDKGEPLVGSSVDFECDDKAARNIFCLSKPGAKNRVAAALLAFFLGGFGVHKFYLGQVGLGILYLLFFWTLIPALIAFIEFIILLCMSDDAFNQRYNA